MQPIKKAVFTWKEKGNEVIGLVNRSYVGVLWDNTNNEEMDSMGSIDITSTESDITIQIFLNTVDIIACDDENVQHTIRVPGFVITPP